MVYIIAVELSGHDPSLYYPIVTRLINVQLHLTFPIHIGMTVHVVGFPNLHNIYLLLIKILHIRPVGACNGFEGHGI